MGSSTAGILFGQILESIEAATSWSAGIETATDIPQDIESHLLRMAELVRMLPDTHRTQFDKTTYRRIMALRNAIVHTFLGRNPQGMLDLIHNDLTPLADQVRAQMAVLN